jgi:hypothetical protein
MEVAKENADSQALLLGKGVIAALQIKRLKPRLANWE